MFKSAYWKTNRNEIYINFRNGQSMLIRCMNGRYEIHAGPDDGSIINPEEFMRSMLDDSPNYN